MERCVQWVGLAVSTAQSRDDTPHAKTLTWPSRIGQGRALIQSGDKKLADKNLPTRTRQRRVCSPSVMHHLQRRGGDWALTGQNFRPLLQHRKHMRPLGMCADDLGGLARLPLLTAQACQAVVLAKSEMRCQHGGSALSNMCASASSLIKAPAPQGWLENIDVCRACRCCYEQARHRHERVRQEVLQ